MDWLRIICAVISISIFSFLIFQTSRFSKEIKKVTNEDRSLSKKIVRKWDRKLSKASTLIIIGTIFAILAAFLSY